MSTVHLYGIPKGTPDHEIIQKARILACEAFDFSSIGSGDEVPLKAALNSDGEFPATTDWRMLKALGMEVEARGAHAFVADQSGVEYDTKGTAEMTPSEYCFVHSGMASCGLEFRALEDESFQLYQGQQAKHWPQGFHASSTFSGGMKKFNVPRVGAHGMFGVTLGAKSWVGALKREDRYEFHRKSAMYWYIKSVKLGSGEHLPHPSDETSGFEMVAELALAFRKGLVGTLFSATKVLLDKGPNEALMELFGIPMFKSYVYEPKVGLLIASDDPVAADAVALAWLFECYVHLPWFERTLQRLLITVNGRIRELGTYGVYDDPVIKRQLELGLGNKVSCITGLEHDVPQAIVTGLEKRLGL